MPRSRSASRSSARSASAEARAALAKAAALAPDVPRYAYVHAVALHDGGDVAGAIAVLTKAHERAPGSREILVALAEYEAQAGNRDAARRWVRTLVELAPEDPAARQLSEALEAR